MKDAILHLEWPVFFTSYLEILYLKYAGLWDTELIPFSFSSTSSAVVALA